LATILVAPLMSCSARLPVYILLIAAFLTTGFAWWMPGLVMFAMYMIGIIVAPIVALLLKRSLLRGETPLFVMEMPMYKWPSVRTVLRRVFDSGWAFIRRAGTLILASMVLVWALLCFPSTDANGQSYDEQIAKLRKSIEEPKDKLKEVEKELAGEKKELAAVEKQLDKQPESAELAAKKKKLEAKIEEKTKPFTDVIEPVETKIGELHGEWKRQSVLGRMGHAIEPLVEPLGWDWKIGMAALASFPAREVVVGTLGQIYNQGKDEDSDSIREAEDASKTKLGKALREAKWDEGSKHAGEPVYSVPTALSIMVFFALCCQCASTLAIIRRETGSWRWPAFTFGYMTALAYVAALLVFQIGSRLG
jgi:ferrous iron transport protein B